MKKQDRRFVWRIWGVLAAVFVLTLALVAVGRAEEIRDQMLTEVETLHQTREQEIAAVGEGEETDPAVLIGQYQKVLTDTQPLSYRYYGAGILTHLNGELVTQSRNMMICTFMTTKGKLPRISETVPMGFWEDNDADVWVLLSSLEYNVADEDQPSTRTTFDGFWQDGIYYVTAIDSGYFTYTVDVPVPEHVETVRYEVGDGAQYASVQIVSCAKSHGGGSITSYNPTGGWKKTDRLIEELYEADIRDTPGEQFVTYKNSLFRTVTVSVKTFSDKKHVYDENMSLKMVYGVSFSPLGLAMSELMMHGTLVLVLVIFLLAGAFLVTVCRQHEQRQVQGYKDEIYRQQQALRYAEDAEKSRREMTGAIAHELKTPIAVLSSYAEALQENIDAEKQSYYLGVIREETDKMDRMVLELLDLSRLEAGKYKLQRENFDLQELAQEIVKPLEGQIREKNITLEWKVGEVLINADRYRFGQVVENFMTNAIRHTPDGGKIVLRIGMNRETFSVENQGSRLPQENLKKVWETFWQGDRSRNQRGTGLGLSIVKTIVELHGGSVKAENTAIGVRFSANLREESTKVVSRKLPQEQVIELEYPIAQDHTTVKQMFSQLGLLEGKKLRQELNAGGITCGGMAIKDAKTKLLPGYVVLWKEFRITIILDNDAKRRALLSNQFQATGRLSNFAPNVGAYGSGMK